MKSTSLLTALILAILTSILFAQQSSPHFKNEKHEHQHQFSQRSLARTGGNSDLRNCFQADRLNEPDFGKRNFHHEDEWMKNADDTDGLMYVCDTTISYSTNGEMEKKIYTHNAEGRSLVELTQIGNYSLWVNFEKQSNSYDASGSRISELYQFWDSVLDNWGNYYKISFTYDASGNMLSELHQLWNYGIGNWVNSHKYSYAYDASGNRLSYLSQNWDSGIENWVNSYKASHTYDASDNHLSSLIQEWKSEIGNWVNYSRNSYTYDTSGNMLSDLYQVWDTGIGNWVNSYNYSDTYDASGNLFSVLRQDWDTGIGNWVNNWKYSYTYDASKNMLSFLEQNWDTGIGNWLNTSKYSYTFDASGNRITELYQDWDVGIGNWVDYGKHSITYDVSGNRLTLLTQYWDTGISSWLNSWKYEYQYDYPAQKIEGMHYEWSGEWTPVDGNIRVYLSDHFLAIGYDCYIVETWYSSYLSAIGDEANPSEENTSFCTPNPAIDIITVSNPFEGDTRLRIYNMAGTLVKEYIVNRGENQLSVQNLPQGIYLFVIQFGESVIQNKVAVY